MRVAKDNRVDARHAAGDLMNLVLAAHLVGPGRARLRIAPQSGVRCDQDQIRPVLRRKRAQLRHRFFHGLTRRLESVGSIILRLLPGRNRRRGDPDHRDFHAGHGLQQVMRERFRGSGNDFGIRRQPWKAGIRARPVQVLQAVVEFVVAHHHGVVAQRIHCQHHRVVGKRLAGERELQRQMAGAHERLVDVFERSSLDRVAAIDQQVVRIVGARGADQGGDLDQPAVSRLVVVVVVERVHVAMHVRGGQNGQADPLGGKRKAGAGEQEQEGQAGARPHVTPVYFGADTPPVAE